LATANNPYPQGTPNYTLWNLMHLTKGPGSDQALQNASNEFGIDFNNHNAGFQIARYLLPTLYPSLLQQQLFANGLQPVQQNAASQMLTQLQNPDAMANQYRAKVNAQAGSTLQNVLQRLRSSGAGIGAMQGAAINSTNQANTAANQFQAQQDSPQGQMNRLNAILALIASQQPNLSTLMNLNGITQATPRGQSGLQSVMGALGQIGQIAGMASTGGGMGSAMNLLRNPITSAATGTGAAAATLPHGNSIPTGYFG
jgi:hypothetical protein